MSIKIVLGLGFGDEGKGNIVNAISNKDTIIVRFNGGTQAGHTVYQKDIKHVFSGFGSGTLKGAITYLSEFMSIDPLAVDTEFDALMAVLGNEMPDMYANLDTSLITPYDVMYNRTNSKNREHGTCGGGYGTSIDRQEKGYSLRLRDLEHNLIFLEKLELVRHYYLSNELLEKEFIKKLDDGVMKKWIKASSDILNECRIIGSINDIHGEYEQIVFEGAQGIMLDKDYGFFPHVTRSNTTSKNAWKIIESLNDFISDDVQVIYVTRAYQTRHGNGPMIKDNIPLNIKYPNDEENNVKNEFQGEFRKSPLNTEMMDYAITCDSKYSTDDCAKVLAITCLDQIDSKNGANIPITLEHRDIPVSKNAGQLVAELDLDDVILCANKELVL